MATRCRKARGSGRVLCFELPFARFDVVAAWDSKAGMWRATDNGMAAASWLTAYDQWPDGMEVFLGACGVSCCRDEFSALGSRAEDAARRLIAALCYLDELRKRSTRSVILCHQRDI